MSIAGCAGSTGPGPGPRPEIDACPAGGTLRVTLWDVYATPRRPDGMVWDGVESGTLELVCSAAADEVRSKVRDAIDTQLPGAGTAADWLAGDAFEREIADICGLATNWVQMRFEGPDLVAFGAFAEDLEWRWRTPEASDTWNARLNTTTTGGAPSWEIACDAPNQIAALGVIDVDLVFDDEVGVVGLDLSSIPDSAICNGWAYYPGLEGIAGVLVRLDVLGAAPICP